MAARAFIPALLNLRSIISSSSPVCRRLPNAYSLPFYNFLQALDCQTKLSNGNPKYFWKAAKTESKDSDDVLKMLRHEKDPQKISEIFSVPVDFRNSFSRLLLYQTAVKKLRDAKAFDKVEEIVERFLDESKPCTEETAIQIMRFYGLALMSDHALKTFQRLTELGIDPSIKAFNSLLSALVDARKHEMVCELSSKINDFGFSPNLYTYNITLKAQCETNDFDSAIRDLGTMKEKGFKPSAVTYHTILDCLFCPSKLKEIGEDKMEGIMTDLLKSCSSEAISYGVRIRTLCVRRKTEEALAVLREAMSKRLTLNPHTYNSLVITLCLDGKVKEAKEVFQMIKDRRRRSASAYNTLAYHSLMEKDYDTALTLCLSMFSDRLAPNRRLLYGILDYLLHHGKVLSDPGQLFIRKARKFLGSFGSKYEERLPSIHPEDKRLKSSYDSGEC